MSAPLREQFSASVLELKNRDDNPTALPPFVQIVESEARNFGGCSFVAVRPCSKEGFARGREVLFVTADDRKRYEQLIPRD